MDRAQNCLGNLHDPKVGLWMLKVTDLDYLIEQN